MTSPRDDSAPRFKIGCFPLTGLLLVALIVFGVVALRLSAGRHQRAIDAEIARLRASGKPASAADLTKWHSPPAGAIDITQVWLAALAPFDTPAYNADAKGVPLIGAEGKLPLPSDPWPEQPQAEQFLTKQQATLARLLDASQRAGIVRYPHKFEDGFRMMLPEVQRVRGAARILSLDANLRARQDDPAGVTRDLHAMFRAAATLEHEPVWICQLVRIAVLGMACRDLERLLPCVPFTAGDLDLLQRDLSAARTRLPLQQANWGERVTGLSAFQEGAAGALGPNDGGPPAVLLQLTRGADTVCYLELMRRYDEAGEKPWPETLAAANKVEQDIKLLAGDSMIGRQRYPMTLLILPALNSAMQAGARNDALVGSAETAVAVQRHRLDQGKLPGQLADLVPKYLPSMLLDPFDGQPLRYLPQANGYVVYSVGQDGKDDGGQDVDGKPDVAIRVEQAQSVAESKE